MGRLVNFLVLLGLGVGLITFIPFCCAQTTVFSDSKLISVDFKEADLKDVIGILSVMTGLNIVVDDDVEGEITARFEDVPVLQAFQMILEINECQYEILDDIIKVTKIPILTRSFPLEFALASEVAELVKTHLSPEGSLKINEETNILIISDKGTNLKEIEETIQEIDSPSLQLDTKVFSFKFIRADEAASLIQDQLSEVGKVEIVLPTNSLLVTDASYNLTKLEDLVLGLDVFQPIKKIFTLKFALANEVVKLISDYLNSEDKIEINEEKNEIILISSSYTLGRIEEAIQEIDSPSLQLDTKVFSFKFIRADEAASLIQDQLSEVGKVEIVLPTNSLQVTDTSYNLTKLEDFISILDVSQPREEKSFTLKFALVSDVEATLKSDYFNPGDEIIDVNVNKEKNEIVLASNSSTLKKIEDYLKELDVPEKNISKKEFSAEYLSLEELADLVRENFSSWGEIVEQDEAKNILIAKDTSYNLFKIGKVIEEKDVFASLKKTKTYKLKYASASSLAERAEDFLSEKGEVVEVDEEKSRFVVEDLKKNLEKIDELVKKVDNLEAQLTEKEYTPKYLTPQQVKEALQLKNILSEHGQIYVPEVKEGAGAESAGVESVKVEKDYIVIPQEEIENTEKEESQEGKINPEENNVIYITVLKKNLPALEQAIEEIDSPFQVITRTFFIPEGSLERIVMAIANIIGVSPEDIQGIEIEEETEWIKMKVTSPTIGLGDIGAVGKK